MSPRAWCGAQTPWGRRGAAPILPASPLVGSRSRVAGTNSKQRQLSLHSLIQGTYTFFQSVECCSDDWRQISTFSHFLIKFVDLYSISSKVERFSKKIIFIGLNFKYLYVCNTLVIKSLLQNATWNYIIWSVESLKKRDFNLDVFWKSHFNCDFIM